VTRAGPGRRETPVAGLDRNGRPRRAEIPFDLPSYRGDTVLEIDGELRVWPRHRNGERRRTWYEQRFLPTLRPLTELDVERVLVTHGEPVLRDGESAREDPSRRSDRAS